MQIPRPENLFQVTCDPRFQNERPEITISCKKKSVTRKCFDVRYENLGQHREKIFSSHDTQRHFLLIGFN